MQASEEQNRQRDQKLRNVIGDEIDRSERPDFFSEAVVDHDKIAYHIDKTDWYRHEGFFPVIIGKQEWKQVQHLLKQQGRPANSNQAKHRYAGLPRMWECVHSCDSLLERQEPCGICVPWVSSEWKNLLLLPPHS